MSIVATLRTYTAGMYMYGPPEGVAAIDLIGRGGGGGGTSGVTSATAASRKAGAGGGGGAVQVLPRRLRVSALSVPLLLVVGQGGSGGAFSAASGGWNPGSDGEDTTVRDLDGLYLLKAAGGKGATDWQIAGAAGGFGVMAGGNGGAQGAKGGDASGFPVRYLSGGGGGGSGGGYNAAGSSIPAWGSNNFGGASGLIPSPAATFGLAGTQPPLWQTLQSGTGGNGGAYSTGAAGAGGAGGYPAGGGGGGGGGNPAGSGGRGADGLLVIIEYSGDLGDL